MKENILLSIICTVKNGENTIKDTIDSVLCQTFKNWEFIIINDGSKDNTIDILNNYNKKDSRIKIVHTEGIGRGKSLNLAIRQCSSEYIMNIDADDLMHPKKLEFQYAAFIKEDYFLLCTDHLIIYEDEKVKWDKTIKLNTDIIDINELNLKKNQVDHSSVIMKKDILVQIGMYDENRLSQFDYELWLRAGYKGFKLGKINNQLVAKRIHSKQSFERKRFGQLKRSVILQSQYIIKEKKYLYIIYPIGRIILGVFPFKMRRLIKKMIKI